MGDNPAGSKNNHDTDLSGSHSFIVTDICYDLPLYTDTLTAELYTPYEGERVYRVDFSQQSDSVTVYTNSYDSILGVDTLAGIRIAETAESWCYSLIEGIITGGSFIVWHEPKPVRAEFTLNGSGLPIAWSERGDLIPQ